MKKHIIISVIMIIIGIVIIIIIGKNQDNTVLENGVCKIESAELREIGYDNKVYRLNKEELIILNEYYNKEKFLSDEPVGEYMDMHSTLKIYDKDGNQLEKFYVCSNGTMYTDEFYKVQYIELMSIMKELIKLER